MTMLIDPVAPSNAYTEVSSDPTYTVPSAPMAGDEYTWPPVS